MAALWPDARVTGLDSSPQMLDKARALDSGVDWLQADLRTWEPEAPLDLLYSNAVLQWVDGHEHLLPALLERVAPGGALAVQMPLSWDMPVHRLMRETLAGGPDGTGERFGDETLHARLARRWVGSPDEYYDLLAPLASELRIWSTEYLQVLEGDDPVLEWIRGTGLRPVLETLDREAAERYLLRYRERLGEVYPRRPDGRTLFPFPRLFIVAWR